MYFLNFLLLLPFSHQCEYLDKLLSKNGGNTIEKIYCLKHFPVETLSIPIPNSPFVINMFHYGTRINIEKLDNKNIVILLEYKNTDFKAVSQVVERYLRYNGKSFNITRLDNQNIVILFEYKMPYKYSKLNNDSLEMTHEKGYYVFKYLHDNSISGPIITALMAQGDEFDNISFSKDFKSDIKNTFKGYPKFESLCNVTRLIALFKDDKHNKILANTIDPVVRTPERPQENGDIIIRIGDMVHIMPYMYSKLNNDSFEMTFKNGSYSFNNLHNNSVSEPIAAFVVQGSFNNIYFSKKVKLDIKLRSKDNQSFESLLVTRLIAFLDDDKHNNIQVNTIKPVLRFPELPQENGITVSLRTLIMCIGGVCVLFVLLVGYIVKLRISLNSKAIPEKGYKTATTQTTDSDMFLSTSKLSIQNPKGLMDTLGLEQK